MLEHLYPSVEHYVRQYEARRDCAGLPPHRRMLERLFAPYNDPRNGEEFLAALEEKLSAEEAAVWCAYPEYTIDAAAKTPAQIRADLPADLQGRAEALSAALAEKGFLYPTPTKTGENGYLCTYLLDVIVYWTSHPDGSKLAAAVAHYWEDLMQGDSARLRRPYTEHRVIPHEGALTGETRHGRIPMDLAIPDGREVLDMDRLTAMLRRCRRFAVMPCICRTIEENKHARRCDFPIEDVCVTFDQAAEAVISSGAGREVTMEELLEIVRRCRDMGLVQVISNAEHPLALCNCCSCCCLCLRTLQRYEDVVCGPARFEADPVRREKCVACGKCETLCPMGAVYFEHGAVQVRGGQCVGCGVCVSQCPGGVLRLVKKPGAETEMPVDTMDRVYI